MTALGAGISVLDDPSTQFDLDMQIQPRIELPPEGGRDAEDAIPYEWFF